MSTRAARASQVTAAATTSRGRDRDSPRATRPACVGYGIGRDATLTLDVFNLFDRKASDIDYSYYASRLPGEPLQCVNDIHFHPVGPRSVRLTLTPRP